MSIPEIEIDPVSNAVKTAAGDNVSIFIDFIPATKEDLQGMKTTDVKKWSITITPKTPFSKRPICHQFHHAEI